MKTALIFPGQGSQAVGMGRSLYEGVAGSRRVFEEAESALSMAIAALCFEGPEESLRLTANTQPAILTVSIAAFRALEERGVQADYVAGHSLGEYSALVAAGCLKFPDAVTTVRRRGIYMQEAVPEGEGGMAAIVGFDLETVESICRDASELGICSAANINSPSQVVIAGHLPAVERAVALARERGARRAVMIAVSAPFHCELMKPAAERLCPALDEIEFSDLKTPLVTNVDARIVTSAREAKDALIRQVASPVLWSRTVELLLAEGVRRFIEVGPGRVLSGLVRQVSRECQMFNVQDLDSLEQTLSQI